MYGGGDTNLAIGTTADIFESEDRRRKRLGEFLKQKRATLSPSRYDLPVHRRRRVAGLRREEVALLAGISVTWYTQLESGASITVSPALLRRLGDVREMTELERAFLFTLAIDEMSVVTTLLPELEAFSGSRIAAVSFEREIVQVLSVHRSLKIQIYAACMRGTIDDLRPNLDEAQCPIGLWLHDDLSRARRNTPEYDHASRVHAEFHRQIDRVVAAGSYGTPGHLERLLVAPGKYVSTSAELELAFSSWGRIRPQT
jgi:transcriptional regulator with XRE-family HTH domain